MPRSEILNFLHRNNSTKNLDTNIWGENAQKAVAEALNNESLNFEFSQEKPEVLIEHLQTNELNYGTKIISQINDINFPLSSHIKSKNTTKLIKYNNAKISNWHGYHITETNQCCITELSSVYAPLSLLLPAPKNAPTQHVDVGFTLFHDTDPNNYCHFLLDVLTQCYMLPMMEMKPVILLPEFKQSDFHKEFFTALKKRGFSFLFIKENDSCSINTLYGINLKGRTGGHPALNANIAAINYLTSLINTTSTPIRKSILWISREKTRRVLEEDIIIETLRGKYNVTSHNLNDLTVEQQANLFNAHELIIGPHGAAYTNMIFQSDPKTRKIVEIFCKGNGTPAYAILAQALGHSHYSYVGQSIETDHPNYPNISLDVHDFVEKIQMII